MAYIKIFPIKVTDKKALDYITNPDKTDEKLLVSSFGCSPETADLEFAMKMDLPPVCQPEKKVKAIKRTWNIIVAPVGKPNYVLQLIRQSELPSTMRNFYKKCS